jgi:hypothetical protein
MPQKVVIVGGLDDGTTRDELLDSLGRKSGADTQWEWIRADEVNRYRVPPKYLYPLLAELSRTDRSVHQSLHVVKLHRLHGHDASKLYALCEPVPVPKTIDTAGALIEWLFSPEANLVPRHEWYGNCAEAALVAILSKLLRNKSWNNDNSGHAWTKEQDLLRQSPVFRREFPDVSREAEKLLSTLNGSLLLCKGGKQGKTPKEWSIHLGALGYVKESVMKHSLDPMRAIAEMAPIIERACRDEQRHYRLDGEIVNERVRQICSDRCT